jgi:hypothetical protein
MGMESFNATPAPQEENEKTPQNRMDFLRRINKGLDEKDPIWESANKYEKILMEKLNLHAVEFIKLMEEEDKKPKESRNEELINKKMEEGRILDAGYNALQKLYMTEMPEDSEKYLLQDSFNKALEIAKK